MVILSSGGAVGLPRHRSWVIGRVASNLYLVTMNYTSYIQIDPGVRFGKPVIKGTRITVSDVLSWLALGMSVPEILHDYPELEEAQIRACLAYAADREHKFRVAS